MASISTFEQQIADIVFNSESGSSQLVTLIQDAFHGIEHEAPDKQRLGWAIKQLRDIDRSMVVVHHLLNALEPCLGTTFFQALNSYERRWADLPQRVVTQLIRARDWSNCCVLLHSRSGMVLEAVRCSHEQYSGLHFYQTRSEPGGEGVSQFRELQRLKVKVQLVEDEQVAQLADLLDAAWLGVDQYNANAFVNKVGSLHITNEMAGAGKATFILGDPRKQVDTLKFSTTLFEAVPFTSSIYLLEGNHEL